MRTLLLAALGTLLAISSLSAPADDGTAAFVASVQAAEAAYEKEDYATAAKLYEGIVQANPVNPGYLKRLADSHYRAHEYAAAIPAYTHMLDMRADQPSYCAFYLARAYAQAGDRKEGMRWLRQAMAWGYPKLEDARSDAGLANLHGEKGYADLMGTVDTSHMDRVQGWRYDLAFLSRWVKARDYHPFRTSTGDRFVSRAIRTEAEFDAEVKRLYLAIPKLNDAQVSVAMLKLVADLGEGHTEWGPAQPGGGRTLPLKFEIFQEGLFITAAEPAYRGLLGAQVLAFDGHPTQQVIAQASPYLSRDNDNWITAFLPQMLRDIDFLYGVGIAGGLDGVKLRLKGMDGAVTEAVVSKTSDAPYIWNMLPSPQSWTNLYETLPASVPVPQYLQKNDQLYWFDYDPARNLVYFQFNRVLDGPGQSLEDFTARLGKFLDEHEVDKLVIDMRWNNGGNTYLVPPLTQMLVRHPALDRKGHLFVIIGPRTFSAALNAAETFERQLDAVFVGEPTGGKPNSPGEEWFFTLPYSKANVSLSNLYWESGWPVDSRWAVPPNIYTPRSFADYLTGRDPAMDAVLAYPAS